MTDEDNSEPVSEEIVLFDAFQELIDPEMRAKVEKATIKIIQMDDRLFDPDIETYDAIKDWVRAEAVLDRAFVKYMQGDTSASNERMFRAAMTQKNALRDEIFGKFKDRRSKREELYKVEKILIDTDCIQPKKEVDILASK